MYAREVDGRTLTLGVSGKLWEGSLVMVDEETDSLWSHLLGEAMEGPLKGETLEVIPSTMTDWKTWNFRYPEGSVVLMERSAMDYRRAFHHRDSGLALGLVIDKQARAYPFSSLHDIGLANDVLAEVPLLVTFDNQSFTASAFDRRLDGDVLVFERDGDHLRDKQTGSTWDSVSGRATDGKLRGKRLRQLPGIVSDAAVWSVYHAGDMWSPPRSDASD